VLQDADLNRQPRLMSVRFSNRGTHGDSTVRIVPDGRIFSGETVTAAGELAAVFVELAPMEVQILA
jgi:hypothetical protein